VRGLTREVEIRPFCGAEGVRNSTWERRDSFLLGGDRVYRVDGQITLGVDCGAYG